MVDSVDTPNGCWVHYSHLEMAGYRTLSVGQRVTLEWVRARPEGNEAP